MIPFAILALAASIVPIEDWRNTRTPGPETRFTIESFATRAEWQARSAALRRQILSAAGLAPLPERTPLNPRFVWRVEKSGVAVDSVLLETLPGYFLGGNLYRPLAGGRGRPAVLVPHGHWSRGRLENLPSYSVPALCMNLARQGYVVFAHDMAGYNDTRQTPHGFGGWREQLWSFNPLGLQLWNSIRALDFLQSLPEVDRTRIAVTGASGGATQTILLAAVDGRVRVSAPVCMVSAHAQGADPCEEAPGLRAGTFNVEFAAMMAPRPMLLVSATGDWTKHTPEEEFPAIRRIYELYGADGLVANFHQDAGHNYNQESREAVYRFFARHLLHAPVPAPIDVRFEADDLLALRHTRLPEGALDYGGLFREWMAESRREAASAGEGELRERLRDALGSEWPADVVSVQEGERLVLSRPGRGDRVPGLWLPGAGPLTVVVHPGGADAARKTAAVAEMEHAGRFLYLIDAFQTGSARAPRDRSGKWFLSYNRTDDAARVQDILTALAFAGRQSRGAPRLVGLGNAGVWCLFAAAVAPVPVELHAEMNGFTGTDEDFRERFFVPGIQRAGGLAAALQASRKSGRGSNSRSMRIGCLSPICPVPDLPR